MGDELASTVQEARSLIPGGSQTLSKSPSRYVHLIRQDPYVQSAHGCKLTTQGGATYLDMTMALGAVLLGYGDPHVDEAVHQAVRDGVLFSLPSVLETRAAERFLTLGNVPWAEQVRFGLTGTDVTTAAVRIARAETKREAVAITGYHGWGSWSIAAVSPAYGVLVEERQQVRRINPRLLGWQDALTEQHTHTPFAAVVVELAADAALDQPLEELREWCDWSGALLIHDELLSGFRYRMGSAVDLAPDLACFGKAMANGYPLSALVGPRNLMRWLEPGGVFFSGTQFGNTLGLAAGMATWEKLHQLGSQSYAPLAARGVELRRVFNQAADRLGVPLACLGDGPRTVIRPVVGQGGSQAHLDLLQQECAKLGLLTLGANNLSFAHDGRTVQYIGGLYGMALERMAEGAVLEGDPPTIPYRVQ